MKNMCLFIGIVICFNKTFINRTENILKALYHNMLRCLLNCTEMDY